MPGPSCPSCYASGKDIAKKDWRIARPNSLESMRRLYKICTGCRTIYKAYYA